MLIYTDNGLSENQEFVHMYIVKNVHVHSKIAVKSLQDINSENAEFGFVFVSLAVCAFEVSSNPCVEIRHKLVEVTNQVMIVGICVNELVDSATTYIHSVPTIDASMVPTYR